MVNHNFTGGNLSTVSYNKICKSVLTHKKDGAVDQRWSTLFSIVLFAISKSSRNLLAQS